MATQELTDADIEALDKPSAGPSSEPPKELTDADIDSSSQGSAPPQEAAPASPPSPSKDVPFVEGRDPNAPTAPAPAGPWNISNALGFNKADLMKQAKDVNTVRRGVRGAVIGTEKFLMHPTKAGDAIISANEAMQPGYRIKKGNRLINFIPGMLDPVNIAAAIALPGSGLLKGAAGQGGAAVGLDNLLEQLEATGRVDPKELTAHTLLGGVLGIGTHLLTHGATASIEMGPSFLMGLTGIPKRMTRSIIENPEIAETWKGTTGEIKNLTKDAQTALTEVKSKANEVFDQALGKLGMRKTSAEMLSGEQPRIDRYVGPRKTPYTDVKGGKYMLDMGKQYQPEEIPLQIHNVARLGEKLKPADRLKILLATRQGVDHYVDHQTEMVKPVLEPGKGLSKQQGVALLKYRKVINRMIESTPGGEVLRNADATMHKAGVIFSALQQHMSEPGRAEEFLRNTFYKDTPQSREDLVSLMALEKETGKPVIKNLFQSLTAETFKKPLQAARLRASIGGLSAWVVARAMGIPYAVGIGLAAVSQSPVMMKMAIRGLKAVAPIAEKGTYPAALGAEGMLESGGAKSLLHGGVHSMVSPEAEKIGAVSNQ